MALIEMDYTTPVGAGENNTVEYTHTPKGVQTQYRLVNGTVNIGGKYGSALLQIIVKDGAVVFQGNNATYSTLSYNTSTNIATVMQNYYSDGTFTDDTLYINYE